MSKGGFGGGFEAKCYVVTLRALRASRASHVSGAAGWV